MGEGWGGQRRGVVGRTEKGCGGVDREGVWWGGGARHKHTDTKYIHARSGMSRLHNHQLVVSA